MIWLFCAALFAVIFLSRVIIGDSTDNDTPDDKEPY